MEKASGERFEDIEAWQLAQGLIRKVNKRKIERKKMNIEHRTGENEETEV
jgi:hypothetical protein